jgi:hypothetical protein
MYFHLKILFVLIVLKCCVGQQPADKGANAKTKEILDYIAELPKQGKFLSCQYGGISNLSFNLTQTNEIANLTGHVPSVLGCDYANVLMDG